LELQVAKGQQSHIHEKGMPERKMTAPQKIVFILIS
jgi:hypothetical protein